MTNPGVGDAVAGLAKFLADMTKRAAGWDQGDDGATAARINFLHKAAGAFAEDVRRNFKESRSPGGLAWPPLKYRVGKPLILTGLLMRSAVQAAASAKLSSAGLAATLDTPHYAIFHDEGTTRIPQRKFFGPRPDTLLELGDALGHDAAEYIVNGTVASEGM